MAGFLSNDLIGSVKSKFDILHETFARDIIVFKAKKQNIVISTNSNYNSIYNKTNQGAGKTAEQEVIVSQSFKARIYYIKSEKEEVTPNQTKIFLPNGSVKIIVDKTAYEYIREAKDLTFDNNKFNLVGYANPYGFVGNQFYVFYLTPLDEN